MNNLTEIASLMKAHFSNKSENPYVGLRPFEADEGHLFFGRDKQIKDLLQNLHTNHFLSIVGSSGCGKSSLIRAGVIPKLKGGFLTEKRDHWLIATMRPSGDPILHFTNAIQESLSGNNEESGLLKLKLTPDEIKNMGVAEFIKTIRAALENRRVNLLILVDQFEELFTYKTNNEKQKNENNYFINLLLGLANETDLPVYTIITMRSDYIGHCNRFFGLPELLNQSQYLVPRLKWQQIREVIEYPIKLYNQEINPGLLDLLTNDSDKELDQLPVLQHCMMRTYQNWILDGKKGFIEFKHYDETGGLQGAIRKHVNAVYGELNPTEQKIAEYIFRAITSSSADNEPVRHPQQFKAIVNICRAVEDSSAQNVLDVINKFRNKSCAFLTPYEELRNISDNTVIDISHESLMRQWDTLKEWIKTEKRSADKLYWLSDCVINKREYLRGLDVKDAFEWKEKQNPNNEWANRYVDNLPELLTYIKKSKNNNRRRNLLFYGSICLITVAIITAGLIYSSFRAEAKVKLANTEAKLHEAKDLAEKAEVDAQLKRAEADIAVKNAELKNALSESMRHEAEDRAEHAEVQAKLDQAKAQAELLIKDEILKNTLSIRNEAIEKVLELTKEKFYQSPEIPVEIKKQYVLELIEIKYAKGTGDESKLKTLLASLNRATEGLERVKEDPNLGIWIVGQAHHRYNHMLFDSIFKAQVNKYLFYSKKSELELNNTSLSGLENLITAVSRNDNHFAYQDGDSIRVGKIEPDKIEFQHSFSIPKTYVKYTRGNQVNRAGLKKLYFKDDNTLAGLINDSIFYNWSLDGKQLSVEKVAVLDNYQKKEFFPDGSRVIFGNIYNNSVQIWNIRRDSSEAVFNFPYNLGALASIEISPDSKRYLLTWFDGLSIGNIHDSTKNRNNENRFTGGNFINNNDLITFSSRKRMAYLVDPDFKIQDSINLSSGIEVGEEILSIQISPNWEKLLVQVLDINMKKSLLVYEKTSGKPLFRLNQTDDKETGTLVVKKVPDAIAMGFGKTDLLPALQPANSPFIISQWKKYNDLKVENFNSDLMPPISTIDKLKLEIEDLDNIKSEKVLNSIVEKSLSSYEKTDDSLDYSLYYLTIKRLADIYGAKYWNDYSEATSSAFNYSLDTLRYCEELKQVVKLGESALLSAEEPEDIRPYLATDYGNLAFYSMFLHNTNYDSVIRYASRGLQLDPVDGNWIYTNLALGYLFSGRYKEAYTIYTRYKDSAYSSSRKAFQKGFAEDFDDLEKTGILTRDKADIYERTRKIRKFLNGEISSLD